MRYNTICIIQNSGSGGDHSIKTENQYLIRKGGDTYSFWNFDFNAIGASFNRDYLDEQFEKEFGFDFNNEVLECGILSENESEPPATAFLISLDINGVNNILNFVSDNSTNSYEWVGEQKLFGLFDSWVENQKWIFEKSKSGLLLNKIESFDKTFLAKIKNLKIAQEQDNLVIFVGAGISKASGAPLWSELVSELKNGIGVSESNYEVIPQLYFQEHGETNYYKKVSELLNVDTISPNCIHEEISKINPNSIVTTNYDDLIEKELISQGRNYHIVREDKDLPLSRSSNLLIKMHGDLSAKNIVLKEDDYLRYSQNFPLISSLIKSLFATKTVLFIGFSYSDNNLKRIVESVRSVLKERYNPAYLFNTSDISDLDPKRIEYFKRLGVDILGYDNVVDQYLQVKEVKSRCMNESWSDSRGQRTYNLLRFIREFSDEDRFMFENQGVLDKLYSGLLPFSDLPSIPFSHIGNIKPLAFSDKHIAQYDAVGYHLETDSESILRFFDGIMSISENEVKHENPTIGYSIEDVNKLLFVARKLHHSGVSCLKRKNDLRNKFHYPIRLKTTSVEDCNCPKCLIERGDIIGAYRYISYSRTANRGYSNYLFKRSFAEFYFGEYEKCFGTLKDISRESFSKNELHKYCISRFYMTSLKFRVLGLYEPSQIDRQVKYDIIEEIDSVRLEELTSDLKVSQKSRDILYSIINRELYQKSLNTINRELVKVRELYQSYKSPYFRMIGPNYSHNLSYTFRAYSNFVFRMFSYDVFYNDFSSMIDSFIKGMIYTFKTNDERISKCESLLGQDIMFILNYSDPTTTLSFFEEEIYPENVCVNCDESGVLKTQEIINNVYASIVYENIFFKREITIQDDIAAAFNKYDISRSRVNRLISNILLWVRALGNTFVEIDSSYIMVDKIYEIIAVLDRVPFYKEEIFIRFNEFVVENYREGQINNMLDVVMNDNLWSDRYLNKAVGSIIYHHPEYVMTKGLFDKYVNRITERDSYSIQIEKTFAVYNILDDVDRAAYIEKFQEVIKKHKIKFAIEATMIEDIRSLLDASVEVLSTRKGVIATDEKDRVHIDNELLKIAWIVKNRDYIIKDEIINQSNNDSVFRLIFGEVNDPNFDSVNSWIKALIGYRYVLDLISANNNGVLLKSLMELIDANPENIELKVAYYDFFVAPK